VAWCVKEGGWLESMGYNMLRYESNHENFTVKPWPLVARVAGLAGPWPCLVSEIEILNIQV
jgi:hypothetical protein